VGFGLFSVAGFEPITMELSGGQFLPPVQTLVATSIFAMRKCISNPVFLLYATIFKLKKGAILCIFSCCV